MTRELRYLQAASINADISRESQTVTLDLPILGSDVLAVEISLPEFRRFYQHVAAQLDEDPALFDPMSRM